MALFYKFLMGFTFLFLTVLLQGQVDFREGYILKSEGDTIFGEINFKGDSRMSHLCTFKSNDGQVIEYSPQDILGFRFTDSKFYTSRKIQNKYYYLEFLINGEMDVFYCRDLEQDRYFIENESLGLNEVVYEDIIKEEGSKKYLIKSKQHFGLLRLYTQEVNMQKQIDKIKKPSQNNLVKLARNYHKLLSNDPIVVYDNIDKPFDIDPEVLVGFKKYKSANVFTSELNLSTGVLMNITLPRVNEKLLIKTGVLMNTNKYLAGKTIINVPIHLGYIAPKSYLIRPSFTFSLLDPSYSLSLYYNTKTNLNFGVQSWFDFNVKEKNFPLYPYQFIGYGVYGVVSYDF